MALLLEFLMSHCGLSGGISTFQHWFTSEYRGVSRQIVFTRDCVELVQKPTGQNIQGGIFRPISGISVLVGF